ncbi:MAG TPA: DUF1990 domain-containing protein [Acidimicrobiales bacterium]|nr:DUF1990 domain-containing protein [Acidimicrobiales bacterium]
MITVGEPDQQRLDETLREAARLDVTYGHVGSTMDPAVAGYSRTVELGQDTFEAAVEGLEKWVCHQGIGATVHPTGAPIALGTTLLVVLPVGPVRLLVPTRIVAVVDEPDRYGFAYGTLPGHPERGEEIFLIERHPDGRTTATIRVLAEGDWLIARLAAPLVRRVQRVALNRYLAALQQHAAEPTRTTS